MKLELSVADRLSILNLLPEKSDYVTLKIARDLENELSFSDEEIEEWGIVQESTFVRWDKSKAESKGIEIQEATRKMLEKPLIELEKSGSLPKSLLDLFEKIVIAFEDKEPNQE